MNHCQVCGGECPDELNVCEECEREEQERHEAWLFSFRRWRNMTDGQREAEIRDAMRLP